MNFSDYDLNVREPESMDRTLLCSVVTALKDRASLATMDLNLWANTVAFLTAMDQRDLGMERTRILVERNVEQLTIAELNVFVRFLRELEHQLAVVRRAETISSPSGYAINIKDGRGNRQSCPVTVQRDDVTRKTRALARAQVDCCALTSENREVFTSWRSDLYQQTDLEIVAWLVPRLLDGLKSEYGLDFTFSAIELCRKDP